MSDMVALRAHPIPAEATPTHAEIAAGVAQGQRWAHAALYDMLYPVVARTLQKILHETSPDYEDLVQTSFERIVRTLTGGRMNDVVSLPAWAGSITAHVALDSLRAKIRDRKFFDRDRSSSPRAVEMVVAPNMERQLEARRQLEWLQETLARMNDDQAETVVLHDVLGHDLAEVAAMMGASVAAAQRRLSRGHQELLRRAQSRAGKEAK
jgi:RNA polymerase sigma-70 factor (ECF subfamily)